jgi:hypothetical protein
MSNETSVIEKLQRLNPGNISNNQLAYKLSLIISENNEQNNDSTSQKIDINEVREILRKSITSKKDNQEKYYREYLSQFSSKMGLEVPRSSPDNISTILTPNINIPNLETANNTKNSLTQKLNAINPGNISNNRLAYRISLIIEEANTQANSEVIEVKNITNYSKSLSEKLRAINPGNISNNRLAYRLSLLILENRSLEPSSIDPSKSPTDFQQFLKNFLAKDLQNIEQQKQQLKEKYYQHYLAQFNSKLGLDNREESVPAISRIQKMINQRKEVYRLRIIARETQKSLPFWARISQSTTEIKSSQSTHKTQKFISNLMQIVIMRGEDINKHTRSYEDSNYKIDLLNKEGQQIFIISRKINQRTELAFKATKHKNQEFQIDENNLSESETQKLVDFHPKHQTSNLEVPAHPGVGGVQKLVQLE